MNNLISRVIKEIKPLDEEAMGAARNRQNELTKPRGSLGLLEELSIRIAGIRGGMVSSFEHKAVIVMAADHGVVNSGVCLYPQEVTRQMVFNFLDGGAGINVLSRLAGARVVVVDMGVAGGFEPRPDLICKAVGSGTGDMAQGPAMTRQQTLDSIQAGIEVVEGEISRGLDLVATGEMGIGNTTASSAICAAVTGEPVETVTGYGAGLGDEQLAHKVAVIKKALELNDPDPGDPIDVLSKVGGFEIGGLTGVMLGAAAHRIPVVLDGFISGAAALLAAGLEPGMKDYFIAAHLSAESGHGILLKYLGLSPVLNLGMRLGEGTGAALGMAVVEAAVEMLAGMATFAEAGVSRNKRESLS
ncbi:MAG: nicotinate-nucleotide--dimethylbenzimidazole phosphoribosyltransferase [Dehalococcoidia bacterium]|nr:nicotinate-nucleotide--dimethylbenzimidazole phosphoribosyltransferase [Dehalococcoidia bacterium]